ncbi:MAG TPA: response regulator [Candidatus Paceibacterota bacterium]|nr:response regulator [Candidatus Paceibacterota bacterium]HRZ55789.1 response regulator [Candidatus Paceibacterota bacterium]
MIYIVDDDQSVRTNLARLMRSAGFTARVFASAEDFLAAIDTLEPGCLLLDITLSGQSGLQLQAELNRRQVNLPVIAVSARDDVFTRELARQLGARSFFRKPVDAQALIDAIQWVMTPGTEKPPQAGNAAR